MIKVALNLITFVAKVQKVFALSRQSINFRTENMRRKTRKSAFRL